MGSESVIGSGKGCSRSAKVHTGHEEGEDRETEERTAIVKLRQWRRSVAERRLDQRVYLHKLERDRETPTELRTAVANKGEAVFCMDSSVYL